MKILIPILSLWILFSLSTARAENEHVHGLELEAESYSSDSLYLTESEWTSSNGQKLRLSELRGRPQLIALFYASCESACPAIVDAMKKVEHSIPREQANALGFVLVTFDHSGDTPTVLGAYAKKRGLGKNWTLLQGSEADTRELAVLLGSKFKKIGPSNFAHTNLIALLDEEGRIAARAKALSELEMLIVEVQKLLRPH